MQQSADRALPSGCWPGVIGAPASTMARDGGTDLGGWPGRGPAMTARVGLAAGGGRVRSEIPDSTPCNSLPLRLAVWLLARGVSTRRGRGWLATAAPAWADGRV